MPRTRASCARRRICRAVRLVRPGERRAQYPPGFPGDFEADAWQTGLKAMQHCRRLFPDFFAEHLAARSLTAQALYSACSAFLALVHRDLFAVSDWCDMLDCTDPVAALDAKPWRNNISTRDFLAQIEENKGFLLSPHPELYGIGVRELIDGEMEIDQYGPLTIALWYMAEPTSFGLGLDWHELLRDMRQPWVEVVLSLPQLPAHLDFAAYTERLGMGVNGEHVGEGCLFAYAFGDTGNPVADYTYYEVEAIHGGFAITSWDRAGDVSALVREAITISTAYGVWWRIQQLDPEETLPELAQHLCAVAQQVAGSPSQPKTLADIFAEADISNDALDLSVLADVPVEGL